MLCRSLEVAGADWEWGEKGGVVRGTGDGERKGGNKLEPASDGGEHGGKGSKGRRGRKVVWWTILLSIGSIEGQLKKG